MSVCLGVDNRGVEVSVDSSGGCWNIGIAKCGGVSGSSGSSGSASGLA